MVPVSVFLDPAAEHEGGALLVNKRELARRVLKCSLPTLNELIERYPDFPVTRPGSNGVEYQFDASAVVAFLSDRREQENREAAQRNDLFSHFSLPIDDIAPEEARGLSPAQRQSLARARLAERKLAMESGLLLPAAETRQVAQVAFGRLGKMLDGLPSQLGREFNLPEEVVRSMRARLDDFRRQAVGEIHEFLMRDSEGA
jgi:phage terminase Nu1 subunit (DNA packaging protein)